MKYQKITNLLGSTSDKVPRFINKKWIEVHDQSMLRDQICVITVMHILLLKEKLLLQIQIMMHMTEN